MQIHQAAEKYQDQLSSLLRSTVHVVDDNVWHVLETTDDDDNPCYMLMLNSRLSGLGVGDDAFITKQRGGIRLFKSLEACASALRQIGQDRLVLSL